jgi:hypothetical protein
MFDFQTIQKRASLNLELGVVQLLKNYKILAKLMPLIIWLSLMRLYKINQSVYHSSR